MGQKTGTIDRQIGLLRRLAASRLGLTVEELASGFEVSSKTIRRDLERFRSAGFPLDEHTESHGRRRWRIEGTDPLGGVLCFDEAFALALSVASLGSLGDTELGKAARSAIDKILSGVAPSARDYCDSLADVLQMAWPRQVDYGPHAERLTRLLIAREDRQVCFITYQSRRSTEPLTYPIHPYAFRHYQNTLYVIAHSENHDEVRLFKLDRISDVTHEFVPYTIPDDFDADVFLSGAFGIYGGTPTAVAIRIAAPAARAICESRWHESQTVQRHANGSVTLHLNVALTPELEGWILSIGPDACVASPNHLAQSIAKKAKMIAEQYARINKSATRNHVS